MILLVLSVLISHTAQWVKPWGRAAGVSQADATQATPAVGRTPLQIGVGNGGWQSWSKQLCVPQLFCYR